MGLPDTLLPNDVDQLEPNELVRRTLAGCTVSFGELSRRFRPRLLQLLQQRLGGRWDDAEDVAQETLARAFQRLALFDPRYRFSTWLYTIAFRLASDHQRRQLRQHRHLHIEAASEMVGACGVDARIERGEAVGNLWSTAQQCLDSNQYTVLWLRFGEDLAIEEIARIMGKTQVGIRVLLHRARVKLIQVVRDTASDISGIRTVHSDQHGATR